MAKCYVITGRGFYKGRERVGNSGEAKTIFCKTLMEATILSAKKAMGIAKVEHGFVWKPWEEHLTSKAGYTVQQVKQYEYAGDEPKIPKYEAVRTWAVKQSDAVYLRSGVINPAKENLLTLKEAQDEAHKKNIELVQTLIKSI